MAKEKDPPNYSDKVTANSYFILPTMVPRLPTRYKLISSRGDIFFYDLSVSPISVLTETLVPDRSFFLSDHRICDLFACIPDLKKIICVLYHLSHIFFTFQGGVETRPPCDNSRRNRQIKSVLLREKSFWLEVSNIL